MELVLPVNHVELDQEEMMYLDGGRGASPTFHWWGARWTMTAAQSRLFQHQLNMYSIGAATATGVSGFLGALPIAVGSALAGGVAQIWRASVAHNTTSRGVVFNLTWAGAFWTRGR